MTWFLLAVAASSASGNDADSPDPLLNRFQTQFLEAVWTQMNTIAPSPLSFEQLPNIQLVIHLLQRVECQVAVGGKYAQFVIARLWTVKYHGYWFTSARKLPKNRIQAIFGVSNAEARRIGLLESFWHPDNARIEDSESGVVERRNLLPDFERAHGFKPGSLTPELVRALILLHEHAHQNDAIPDDRDSFVQSVRNTRTVAQACTPSIVEPPPASVDHQ